MNPKEILNKSNQDKKNFNRKNDSKRETSNINSEKYF